MVAVSVIALPWFLARLPADYFVGAPQSESRSKSQLNRVLRTVGATLRNLIGIVLVIAGIAMLVLPGQGLLTMLMGLILLDFPGKQGFQRRLVSNDRVFRALNMVRKRMAVSPFIR